MTEIECKRVDLWDGGDRHDFGFFIASHVSKIAIENANPHCRITDAVVTVYDSLEEIANNTTKKLRQSAWNKLSAAERKAIQMTRPD